MKITVIKELELNRAWIYDGDEIVGETNFVIDENYFISIFHELFPDEDDIDDFLDSYEPEADGEKIYERALADGKLKEDLGVQYYKDGTDNDI